MATWTARIEAWLAAEVDGFVADDPWYVGRPNAAFERRGEIIEYSPTRLSAVETVYAMTIHKSQGSQFDIAAVLRPAPTSRILTTELRYAAATRARKRLILAGTEETIRAAVTRPVARASGLRWRLWGELPRW